MKKDDHSLSQPQPDSVSARLSLSQPIFIMFVLCMFYVCFSHSVSLPKTIIHYWYWQTD